MSLIICIGHAALDRIYRIDRFPQRPTKIRALEHIESGGGMASNAAAAIARLGGRSELWSRIGEDDNGVRIRRMLIAFGVDARYVQSFEGNRTSTSVILVNGSGERLIVGARDVNMPSSTSWLPLERVTEADVVVADVRWLEGARVTFDAARKAGIPTVLDADLGGRDALDDLLKLTDYAIFSCQALEEFAPKGNNAERLQQVARLGPLHAGVTLGADGYLWKEGGEISSCHAFKVDTVDTTGAGDAFHGAFALGLAEGLPTPDNARRACAVAAMKCQRLGARSGLPTADEVMQFMKSQPRPNGQAN